MLKLLEVYEEPTRIHIYENVEGDTLSDLLLKTLTHQSKNKLSLQEVCTIMYKLTEALVFLHDRNVMFRNLKPENIVFTRKNDLSSLKI